MAVNTWAVATGRDSTGEVDWKVINELRQLDRKTKKMTLHGALHPKSDVVGCTYHDRGERGLVCCKMSVKAEENNLVYEK